VDFGHGKDAGLRTDQRQNELFLVWNKNKLPEVIDNMLQALVKQGLLSRNSDKNKISNKSGNKENTPNDTYTKPGANTAEINQLYLLAKIISPILEVYYLTLALLSKSNNKKISRNELEEKCQLMAQRVAMIHQLNSPDYSDKKLIANFVEALIHIDYVKIYDTEHLEYSEVFQRTDRHIRLLLPKEMRANILQMLNQT